MIGKEIESDLPKTSYGGCNTTERGFMSYAEWLIQEATVSPSISYPPREEESTMNFSNKSRPSMGRIRRKMMM